MPCVAEMPNSKILQEKLAGKDIVFAYISIYEIFKQPYATFLGFLNMAYTSINKPTTINMGATVMRVVLYTS